MKGLNSSSLSKDRVLLHPGGKQNRTLAVVWMSVCISVSIALVTFIMV